MSRLQAGKGEDGQELLLVCVLLMGVMVEIRDSSGRGAEQARTRYGECTYQQDADQPNEQGDEDWHDIQQ